jgi:hypothetical protein
MCRCSVCCRKISAIKPNDGAPIFLDHDAIVVGEIVLFSDGFVPS